MLTSIRKSYCLELIKNETYYYSNITNEDKISVLIRYLAIFPQFYFQFDESLKLVVKNQSQDNGDLQFISLFLNTSIEKHFSDLNPDIKNISIDSVKLMEGISVNNGAISIFCDYLIKYFSNSSGYNDSNSRLEAIRYCLVAHIDLQHAKEFLKVSNENRQIYEAWHIIRKLRSVVEKFEGDIDKTQYENIYTEYELVE